MSAPSAVPPRSFEHKYHQIQQACLISRAVLNCLCETKSLSLSFIFSDGLMGRPDLFTGGGGGVFAGSPFWALITP